MSSLPYTSPCPQYAHAWADKPPATGAPTTAFSYSFPFPPAAPPFSRPIAAPAFQQPSQDTGSRLGSSRGQSLIPAPPVPQLHVSPSPAVLAEVLQPAFRRSQPVSSSGCSESRVCELVAAAVQHSDIVRAQAEAQRDTAIGQWMQHCLDDSQRRLDSRLERFNQERLEQAKQHNAVMSAMQERLSTVESGVERLDHRCRNMEEKERSRQEKEKDDRRERAWLTESMREEQQRPAASHAGFAVVVPESAPTHDAASAADMQTLDSQPDENQEEDGDEDEEEDMTGESEPEAEEADEAESAPAPRDQCDSTTAPSPHSISQQTASSGPIRASSSPVPWSSPTQPTPAAQYSRQFTAQAEARDAPRSQPISQPPPTASQPFVECVTRRKGRRRDEGQRLRVAAGEVFTPPLSQSQSTAYEFPASD